MLSRALVCVFLLTCQSDAAPTANERMTLTKMMAEDLDGTASGYVYNQQQGIPVYYVQYSNHGSGRYYHAPDVVQYVATPVAHSVPETTLLHPFVSAEDVLRSNHQGTVNYGNEQSLDHSVAPTKPLLRVPYYVDDGEVVENEENDKEETQEKSGDEDHGNEESMEDDSDEEGGDEETDHSDDIDGEIHGGYHGGSVKTFDHGDGYDHEAIGGSKGDEGFVEEGKGEKHANEEYSKKLVKGEKGYKKEKEFSKAESGSDDSGREEGYHKNGGKYKKGHVVEDEKHGSRKEAEKGKEGSSYGHSSYHKKGQKTNGFHNVYHKDEYKKETDFYDDDYKKGDFEEYEEFDKGYKTDEGDFKKGGHHSSGRDYQDHGEKGSYDKGHYDNQDQGQQVEEGEKSHYSNHEDYNVEEDSKSDRIHEFYKRDD